MLYVRLRNIPAMKKACLFSGDVSTNGNMQLREIIIDPINENILVQLSKAFQVWLIDDWKLLPMINTRPLKDNKNMASVSLFHS